MSSLQRIASYPGIVPTLQATAISAMLFISGLSCCLSCWVIPNALLAPPESQAKQFMATVTKGARYLQTSSRVMMANLILVVCLMAVHPDSAVSSGWYRWAIIACVMITAAPYEIYFIFPTNDEVEKLHQQVEKERQLLTKVQQTKLRQLLEKWAFRNFGRVLLPFVGGMLGLRAVLAASA